MSVRIRYKIEVAISSTDAEERDLANGKYEVVADTEGEGGAWKLTLPSLAVDVPINLPTLAAPSFIAIRATAKDPTNLPVPVGIKKTLGGEENVIAPLGDQREGHFVLTTDGVATLYASNPGAVDMELTVFVAGD